MSIKSDLGEAFADYVAAVEAGGPVSWPSVSFTKGTPSKYFFDIPSYDTRAYELQLTGMLPPSVSFKDRTLIYDGS